MNTLKRTIGIGALVLSLSSCNEVNNAISDIPVSASNPAPLFPYDKTLTVSARDYCESVGRHLSDYNLVGVVSSGRVFGFKQEYLPSGTEVIVGIEMEVDSWANTPISYIGTALVPKKKK